MWQSGHEGQAMIAPAEYDGGRSHATPELYFDYDHQAWVRNGRYIRCGHSAEYNCQCYGRLHAGERAPDSASEYLRLEAAAR